MMWERLVYDHGLFCETRANTRMSPIPTESVAMNTKNSPANSAETRRSFLKKAAAAAAVVSTTNPFKTPVYGQTQAPSPGRVIGANDRIAVAYVGVGGQGMAHVRSQ